MIAHEAGDVSVGTALTVAMSGVCAAAVGAYFIGMISAGRSASDRLKEVQVQNGQIREQLTPNFNQIGSLIIDSSDHSFSFSTVSPARQPETCVGHYVVKNDAANISGALACTRSVSISGN